MKHLIVGLVLLSGCVCSGHKQLLGQLRENLQHIGPRYKSYLAADPRLDGAARDMFAGEVDDSIEAITAAIGSAQ